MTTFSLSSQQCSSIAADAYVLFCHAGFSATDTKLAEFVPMYSALEELIKHREFSGNAGSALTINALAHGKPVTLILVGIGAIKQPMHERLESFRRAVGSAVRAAEAAKASQVVVVPPALEWFEGNGYLLGKEFAATWLLAEYHFADFISEASRRMTRTYGVTICVAQDEQGDVEPGIVTGQKIGFATNQARSWCDTPGLNMPPRVLADRALAVANEHGFKISIFDKKEIYDMGMGGIRGVSQGSAEEPRFVVMEYHTDVPNAPTIALVGKGITFDSGGLSIKPAAAMETMKDDMAGAAVVIATMHVVAHLKPRVNIIMAAPMAENMPSGTATRPGDILKFYDGSTAEVKNTDAEGRLVLADAISYVRKNYKIDHMVTIATLTGACAYALGPFFAGLMSQHDELADKVNVAGKNSGDRVWALPFHNDYKKAVQSNIADLCNIGSDKYRAGAVTAGFFLKHFTGDTSYVHLDIAGTAFNVPDISYYRAGAGATGFGVRLFAEMVAAWK